jgi:hypothetical protein
VSDSLCHQPTPFDSRISSNSNMITIAATNIVLLGILIRKASTHESCSRTQLFAQLQLLSQIRDSTTCSEDACPCCRLRSSCVKRPFHSACPQLPARTSPSIRCQGKKGDILRYPKTRMSPFLPVRRHIWLRGTTLEDEPRMLSLGPLYNVRRFCLAAEIDRWFGRPAQPIIQHR